MKMSRDNLDSHEFDNHPVLLLTATIDAKNTPGAMYSPDQREQQYLSAFRFYLRFLNRHPNACRGIIFCENSGCALGSFRKSVPSHLQSFVEFLSLSPSEFCPEQGKTFNEMLALDKAIQSSSLLRDDVLFLKCTGRYPVLNIRRLITDMVSLEIPVSVCYFARPGRHELSPRFRPFVDTRCIAIRKSVWLKHFQNLYRLADEEQSRFFEFIAMDVIQSNAMNSQWIKGFSQPPLIIGKQGHRRYFRGIAIPKTFEPCYLFMSWLNQWLRM